MLTVYARRENTNDSVLLKHGVGVDYSKPYWQDVVIYHDPDCTKFASVIPWHSLNKPTRRNKWKNMNGLRYRLEWAN